jgi:hypothetical protein
VARGCSKKSIRNYVFEYENNLAGETAETAWGSNGNTDFIDGNVAAGTDGGSDCSECYGE